MNKIELKNMSNLYIYSFLYYFTYHQEQGDISISSTELLYHTCFFDLGHQLNLILLYIYIYIYIYLLIDKQILNIKYIYK